jgi:hypothetical protein
VLFESPLLGAIPWWHCPPSGRPWRSPASAISGTFIVEGNKMQLYSSIEPLPALDCRKGQPRCSPASNADLPRYWPPMSPAIAG